jgi:putative endonuclease
VSFGFITRRLRKLNWLRPPPDPRAVLGRRGERIAARYLRRRRHDILARNFQSPAGEVDLICADGAELVFVEVKSRADFLSIEQDAAAQAEQWLRILRSAQFFAARYRTPDRPMRFDLVTVEWPSRGRPKVDHFREAYRPWRR